MTDARALRDRAVAVIPCLNEERTIASVIERILDDAGWADPLLVVADGGSTDGTIELVAAIAERDPRVRLVHNPSRIQSAAVNLAAALHADGRDWLVRVDAHSAYPQAYVSSLMREAKRVGACSVTVSVRTAGRGFFQRAVACAQNSHLGTGGSAHRLGGCEGFVDHGHHGLFSLDEFLAAGGYDETFTHNEDAELDVRLRCNGGRIWLTNAIEIVYFPRASPRALVRQYAHYGWGRARTLRLHREKPRLRQTLPLAVAPAIVLLGAAPLWPLAATPALLWTATCCLYGVALAVRQRSAPGLLAGPAAMLMHMGWSFGFWAHLLTRRRPPAMHENPPPAERPT